MSDVTRLQTANQLLRIFLTLGCTSFGGPVAHLGYFREEFVNRRGWFTDDTYADIVALAQFLPGPASSQVGMAIGLARGGPPGMLASWIGFTLPSAILMAAFAYSVAFYGDLLGGGWIGGLKAAAAAVVAQALTGMARSLIPDVQRAVIAVLSFGVVIGGGHLAGMQVISQIGAILFGGVLGLILCRNVVSEASEGLSIPVPKPLAIGALSLFALLLAVPIFVALDGYPELFDRFYRAGSLVFGGGHVVLPLLEAEMVDTGFVERDAFLAGYGAAQAVPGPLFSFSAYLGATAGNLVSAAVALVAIFLPSMLLIVGALPFWADLRSISTLRKALAGVNAAVVGLLAAAFYDPIVLALIETPLAVPLAVVAFLLLRFTKCPPWLLVICAGAAGGVIL